MRNRFKLDSKMVQALTILSALQLFSEGLELPLCNSQQGVIRFERIVDVRVESTDVRQNAAHSDSVLRSSEIPNEVLFKCQSHCLKDETVNQGRSQLCGSLDFVPGQRYTTHHHSSKGYTKSKCFLSLPERSVRYIHAPNFYHYREVCYSGELNSQQSSRNQQLQSPTIKECPERMYVIERVLGKRFMPRGYTALMNISSLEDCQQICLNQAAEDPLKATSVCRAGTYHKDNKLCYVSSLTRRTHPFELIDDSGYDYFENTCLNEQRRCPSNKLFWTKEVNAELIGPYDFQIYDNMTLENCKDKCLSNKYIFCRSVEYDEMLRTCVLSDEDTTSRSEHIKQSASDKNIYLELTCIDGNNLESTNFVHAGGQHVLDRQHLTDRNHREVLTAFQIFRNRRLELTPGFRERGREGHDVTMAQCLDACLEEPSFRCRSAIYSRSRKSCRLSEYDQINGNLQYDVEYDYFENLMNGGGSSSVSGIGSNILDNFGGNQFGANNNFNNRFDGSGVRFSQTGGSSRDSFQIGSHFNSGGLSNIGIPLPTGDRNRGAFQSTRTFQSGGSFTSGGSQNSRGPGVPLNTFNTLSSDNRRGNANNKFGSSHSSSNFGGIFGNQFGGSQSESGRGTGSDKFSNVFSRFHESKIGSSSGPSRPIDDVNKRITGSDIFGSSGDNIGFNRRAQSSIGGSQFSNIGSGVAFNSLSQGGVGQIGFSSNPGSNFGTSTGFGSNSGFASSNSGFGLSFGGGSKFGSSSGNTIFDERTQVSQKCHTDGSMEFMLRSAEPFRGRIYTNGYYDRCFIVGRGASINVLKLTSDRGFPECGTMKYADTTSNIVIVQFADGVMTTMDKTYNLTCTSRRAGDTVVTSDYIGSQYGAPTIIEYLPEESRLDSQVRLQILHSGRVTNTVAVGDRLTFRIETLAGRGLVSDIFATNVIARDPSTGRAIELIDSRGCPVQEQVFPALGKARSGEGLETRFSAFKIPESELIVFEAKVRMCRRECIPATCHSSRGRSDVTSYGKRRRRSTDTEDTPRNKTTADTEDDELESSANDIENNDGPIYYDDDQPDNLYEPEEAKVNEVLRVYLHEEDARSFRDIGVAALVDKSCIASSQYYSLLSALFVSVICLLVSLFVVALCYRKHKKLSDKNSIADSSNPRRANRSVFPGSHPRTVTQPARYFPSKDDSGHSTIDLDSRKDRFADPSEPIYTDPSLFERAPESSSRDETSAKL